MTIAIPIKLEGDIKITPENKCTYCRGSTCCTYFTHQLDTPRSMDDFDLLLWQISHQNTQMYKDEDGWFLLINNCLLYTSPSPRD